MLISGYNFSTLKRNPGFKIISVYIFALNVLYYPPVHLRTFGQEVKTSELQ